MPENLPKVLHLLNSLGSGGAERLVADVTAKLPAYGWAAEIGIIRSEQAIQVQCRVHRYWEGSAPSWRTQFPSYIRRTRTIIDQCAPDVIHCHAHNAYLLATLASRAPICLTAHLSTLPFWASKRPQDFLYRFMLRRDALRGRTTLVFLSRLSARRAQERFRLPEERIAVVPNGVDFSRIRRALHGGSGAVAKDSKPRVVWVGRLAAQKNPLLVPAIAQRLRSMGLTFEVVVCGEGPLRGALLRERARLGLEETVRVVGHVGDVTPYLAAACCYLSTSAAEGHSIALLEAMAVGLPVVTFAVPGMREHLEGKGWARLAAPGDVGGLAGMVAEFIRAPGRALEIGELARREASAYSIGHTAEKYVRLYEELLWGWSS